MIDTLCDKQNLVVAVIVLLLAMIFQGAGKGLGGLLLPAIKRLLGHSGTEVNVNMGRIDDEMERHEGKMKTLTTQGDNCLIDPKKCMAHQAEYERSEENKAKIEKLDKEFHQFKSMFFSKLDSIETGISDIKVSIAKFH